MKHLESKLQIACVRWFRYQHPEIGRLLIHVPNGGFRNAAAAGRFKAEGVVAGVSDLVLFVPNRKYHAFFIELKVGKGRQSEFQKEWEELVTAHGYHYRVVRSLEEFILEIQEYLFSIEKSITD